MYFTDWYLREGWMIFHWWFMATFMGVAALPLCARFLRGLPDKGVIFARALGLMSVGFILWFLGSINFLKNTTGGIVTAWALTLGIGVFLMWRARLSFDWRKWWVEHRKVIIASELVFVMVLYGWSLYRASQNSIVTAEKPYNSMMMASIAQSSTFPIEDAWASGYTLDTYYFGQLIGAMLNMLSYTSVTAGFNLFSAMIFALAAQVTFGVVYNLVGSRGASDWKAIRYALIGVVIVNVMSNYEFPLVELPYQTANVSQEVLNFFDVRERQTPVSPREDVSLDTWEWNWWFRPSRTVTDRVIEGTYNGVDTEAITEFPIFSYIHSDNHSHVIGIFALLLLVGLGLNLILLGRPPDAVETVFYGLLVGTTLFIVTWYFPTAILLFTGAEVIRRLVEKRGLTRSDWLEIGMFGGAVTLVALLAMVPLLSVLRPSPGGIVPNLYQATRPQQMFLVMGALLPLLLLFVGALSFRAIRRRQTSFRLGIALAGLLLVGLVALTAFLTVRDYNRDPNGAYSIVNALRDLPDLNTVIPQIIQYRLDGVPTLIVFIVVLALIAGLLLPVEAGSRWRTWRPPLLVTYPPQVAYALLLIGFGIGLLLVPDFFFLHDYYGIRNEIVFKFYYQAWLLLGIGVTFGIYVLLEDAELRIGSRLLRGGVGVVAVIAVVPGLLYAPAAVYVRGIIEGSRLLQVEDRIPFTLDGAYSLGTPDDVAVLRCLLNQVGQEDVIISSGFASSGDHYSLYYVGPGIAAGRVGALTGIPTPLGWGYYARGYRGDAAGNLIIGTRFEDTVTLYTTTDIAVARLITQRYGIDYILYGDLERHPDWYGTVGEQKFIDAGFPVVCESGAARIYLVIG